MKYTKVMVDCLLTKQLNSHLVKPTEFLVSEPALHTTSDAEFKKYLGRSRRDVFLFEFRRVLYGVLGRWMKAENFENLG